MDPLKKILCLTQTWSNPKHDREIFVLWDKNLRFKHNRGNGRGKSIIQYGNLYYYVFESVSDILAMIKKDNGTVF